MANIKFFTIFFHDDREILTKQEKDVTFTSGNEIGNEVQCQFEFQDIDYEGRCFIAKKPFKGTILFVSSVKSISTKNEKNLQEKARSNCSLEELITYGREHSSGGKKRSASCRLKAIIEQENVDKRPACTVNKISKSSKKTHAQKNCDVPENLASTALNKETITRMSMLSGFGNMLDDHLAGPSADEQLVEPAPVCISDILEESRKVIQNEEEEEFEQERQLINPSHMPPPSTSPVVDRSCEIDQMQQFLLQKDVEISDLKNQLANKTEEAAASKSVIERLKKEICELNAKLKSEKNQQKDVFTKLTDHSQQSLVHHLEMALMIARNNSEHAAASSSSVSVKHVPTTTASSAVSDSLSYTPVANHHNSSKDSLMRTPSTGNSLEHHPTPQRQLSASRLFSPLGKGKGTSTIIPLIRDVDDPERFQGITVDSRKLHESQQRALRTTKDSAIVLLNSVIDLVFDQQELASSAGLGLRKKNSLNEGRITGERGTLNHRKVMAVREYITSQCRRHGWPEPTEVSMNQRFNRKCANARRGNEDKDTVKAEGIDEKN